MDDILGLNLPKTQAIQLQSVRLYLRVTILSEITNHSGTHIQPTKLTRTKNRHTHNKDDCSGSTLQWPHQPSPGPAAWKRWYDIVSWLYLVPNSYQLIQPLGLWNNDFDTDYTWEWVICPRTQTLFHRNRKHWYAYLPSSHYTDRITYRNRASLTSPPSNTVPATPIITT